jgi:agmatine deiminase
MTHQEKDMSRSLSDGAFVADAAPAQRSTPRAHGFAMPAEWALHQLTLMSWPCHVDGYVRPGLAVEPAAFDSAKGQQAAVANAVAQFEPVLMLVRSEQLREARGMLSSAVELLEAELDDAWLRDNGPIFVRDAAGRLAMVHFGFNAWGEYFGSYSLDARVPELLADHLGVRRYVAPMVLEGGSFFVDGDGTLITTEQCLLNVNRNPSMTRETIEATLREYLGVEKVLWLGEGHYDDFATDGHVDDVAHFLSPGRVLLHAPSNPAHPDHAKGIDNARRILHTPDARGRTVEIIEFDTGDSEGIPYLNLYVCNHAVIAPIANAPADEVALGKIQAAYPGREVVPVRADVLFTYGGGGPHCITQQVPAGSFVP